MKLVGFAVSNYRSITKTSKIRLDDMTVLIGKNNEGKSNIAKALNVAMMAVILHGGGKTRFRFAERLDRDYEWERDFPLMNRERKSGLETIFRLVFCFDADEIRALRNLNLYGNKDVPIRVRIGRDNVPRIEVPKKGSSTYKEKSREITDFISSRIRINYIQAIRTDEMAIKEIGNIISDELRSLQNNEEYEKAYKKINELEKVVLDNIASKLINPLTVFLPNLKNVIISSNYNLHYRRFRNDIDVIIDDGIPTSITNKGDGIKSLVALAILKDKRKFNGASVIVIEEPESHLHSGAIHNLVEVINKISESNQVIITTHNPLFVMRNNVSSNIIVNDGNARPAKKIDEIREVLGVWPSDNLRNARFVLVVEGENDKIIISKIISSKSDKMRRQLQNGLLAIKELNGVGNLSHELSDLKHNMCKYMVLLDNDEAGRKAKEKACLNGLLEENNVKLTFTKGLHQAELEDCIRVDVYADDVLKAFSVDIGNKPLKGNGKWSEKIKEIFKNSGVEWNEHIEKKVKNVVANAFPDKFEALSDVIYIDRAGYIESLVNVLEKMISAER